MKKARTYLIVATLVGFLISIAMPSLSEQTQEEEVFAALTKFLTSLRDKDTNALEDVLADEFTHFHSSLPYLIEGKADAIEHYEQGMKVIDDFSWQIHNLTVRVIGHIAIVTRTFTNNYKYQGTRMTRTGKATEIFQKENGRWLLVHTHETNNPSSQY